MLLFYLPDCQINSGEVCSEWKLFIVKYSEEDWNQDCTPLLCFAPLWKGFFWSAGLILSYECGNVYFLCLEISARFLQLWAVFHPHVWSSSVRCSIRNSSCLINDTTIAWRITFWRVLLSQIWVPAHLDSQLPIFKPKEKRKPYTQAWLKHIF